MNSVDVVHAFWDEVWNAHDPSAIDKFVVDDFVIVSGGETISGRESFKQWVAGFLAKVDDLHLEVVESFQNARRQPGCLALAADRQEQRDSAAPNPINRTIAMTGTAVWAVREDGKLLTNWVERASWELYQRLTGAGQ